MGLHAASSALLTVLALVAGTQANTLYGFDFLNDLQGWESLRGAWRWADESGIQYTIPSDYKGGFAIMDDQYNSDELYTPYFRVPNGGNFTMRFYLRSKFIGSNDLKVYTRNKRLEVKDFINLKEYSVDYSFYWSIVTKELPPDDEEVRFEIFCYNGDLNAAGEPLLGCGIDQLAFEVYDDGNTTTTTTPFPGNFTTPFPDNTTTPFPGNLTTFTDTTTKVPGNLTTFTDTTTDVPGNLTTPFPGNLTSTETNTPFPDNTTTPFPGNFTTFPDTTTEVPGNLTTPFPGNLTTPIINLTTTDAPIYSTINATIINKKI